MNFDTSEVHTNSHSDGSTIAPDYSGRCLQRALDCKVRKLRTMLTADEDIASELDRVVCRLMKLALRTSRARQHPPPAKWMQCKLFDLLSLTEKAIDRRRKRFIENFPLNALEYEDKVGETMTVAKLINDDISVNMLVDKYQNLVRSYERKETQKERNRSNFVGFEFDEDLSDTSNEFIKEFKCVNNIAPSNSAVLIEPVPKVSYEHDFYTQGIEESKLQRIQAWVDDDLEVVPYPNHDVRLISSGDTDHSATNMTRHKFKKMSRKRKLTLISYPDKQDSKIRKKCIHLKTSTDNNTKTCIQEKIKTSNTKLKKTSSKKSNYCLLVKANLYKTSSNSFGKLRNKKGRESSSPNTVKPIPSAFKELCHPDLNAEKKLEENIKYLTDIDRLNDGDTVENTTNVSATEESLLVDIVMDGLEETIALRRTIGTDAEDETIEFEQETVLGSLINVMRNDSFCNNAVIETGNVNSQTIFLNDINEPSTSKGVRHVSMDVQCGPDVTTPPAFSTLSTTTSFTRLPKMFATGIKIGDSEMEVHSKLNCDFGTYTGDNDCHCNTITPRTKSVGIKIKDSDTYIVTKIEEFKMTQTDEINDVGCKETEMIKAISSGLKMVDSGSECFGSVSSNRKSLMIFDSSPGIVSDIMLKSSISKEAGLGPKFTCMKYVPPKLSRGGVYVHSFKDKQLSEDILYQGGWQCSRPKALTKKRVVFNTASVKKLSELTKKLRVSSKEKLHNTKFEKGVTKLEQKYIKSVQVRSPTYDLTKVNDKNSNKTKTVPNGTLKNTKYISRNITKTSPKLPKSSSSANKPKAGNVMKKPVMLSSKVTRKEPEIKGIIKTPEAKTLKRIANTTTKSILNKSFDSAKILTKTSKDRPIGHVVPLVRSKTQYIKKELLKFDDSPRDNISYVVLRNSSENKNNNNSSMSPKTNSFRRSDSGGTIRRSLSPQSPTSSTCSSPNSIATVRLASNRPRTTSRNPGSDTPIRNKKFTKKSRILKKNDVNNIDDKENIPESSNGSKKENERKTKNSFIKTQKSVYRAQVKTETLPLQNALNSLSRPKTSTPKNANLKTAAERMTRPSRSSVVKGSKSPSLSSPEGVKRLYKASSPQQSITMFSWSTELASTPKKTNMITVAEGMKRRSRSSVAKDSKSPSTSSHEERSSYRASSAEQSMTMFTWSTELVEVEKRRSHSLPREVNSSERNISISLKKMIEDRLDFIQNSSDNVSSIDSKILDYEHLNRTFDGSTTPDSYKTVVNNEDLNNTLALRNDLENAVNRTFDSIADATANDENEVLTDTDVLSFKTTTATSRASEYFLANDNDLDNFQSCFTKKNSVRDIFERKNPLNIQSNGNILASQAFSGFSISAVAGDQPDPINLLDSETGSLAVDMQRQATSEEVFVSGRSSGSYESCMYDDEAMLPYWLFHINSQFVDEEEEQEAVPPVPVQLPEAAFDMNGNMVAAGAGAGDGRGMHSDHSQDSSGHGTTSTTSSDPSSGVQSEAILIDPSAFTGQYELPAAGVAVEIPDVPLHEGEYIGEAVGADRNGRRNPVVQLLATSDMDADVSSLDTDVQDSS